MDADRHERGVVCLSVHDSIIVPLVEQNGAVQVLREEYRRAYADDIGEERLPGALWQREEICHLADALNSFVGIC